MRGRSMEPYPAWSNAELALKYISKGKARGCKAGLWVRNMSQCHLGQVGTSKRSCLVMMIGLLAPALLCIGIQYITLDTTLDSLWTPDSGRLQRELNYINKSKASGLISDTNEMLIQTPKKDGHRSILTARALLEHLDVLQKALLVTVDMYDLTWNLKDLCYSPNIPTFEIQFIDQIFEKIFPCGIVTPLDCFWEGAKLLGPDYPIKIPAFGGLKWTNLNPEHLVRLSKTMIRGGSLNVQGFPFEILEGLMRRARIGTGYQEKPCLDPMDPECPITSPNKGISNPLDVANILANGCYGFAPRFMYWAPELIVGGQVRNKSGSLIRAGGLMSTIQLMSSYELFDYSKDSWRLNGVQWNEAKAQEVLEAWQARFTQEVARLSLDDERSNQFNFYSFTAAGLDSVVEIASQFSWISGSSRVIGIIGTTTAVAILLNGNFKDWKLRAGLLLAGSIIGVLGTAAGCGLSGFLQIPFNVATVQVLPYLAISLGSQVFFLLLYCQLNGNWDAKTSLKRHGFSILLGIVTTAIFVGGGGWFSIPAVRSLALQGAVLLVVTSLALLVVFPGLCQIVLRKKQSNRMVPTCSHPISPGGICATKIFKTSIQQGRNNNLPPIGSDIEQVGDGTEEKGDKARPTWTELYFSFLKFKWYSGLMFCIYLSWLIFSGVGICQLRLGLLITDVVPSNSSEWQFLTAQMDLFPVYHIRAVTQVNFDYPNNQKLLHKFHDTMSSLPWIIRDDNGGIPPMWLSVFRQWLQRLQTIFDEEWRKGYLLREEWTANASTDGILAWKMAVQTGHGDHPVDVTQLPGNRLVDNDGIINPRSFYVYLSVWAWNDPLAYGSTAANLRPEPKNWVHVPEERDLKIPKSNPIKYAEISYTLKTSKDENSESQILTFVREIRTICSNFEARGLPVFPWGTPFRYYEQYLNLPIDAGIVIGLVTTMVLVTLFVSLGLSFRPVGVIASVGIITMIQIIGTIGWLGIGLNSLPVEIALLGISFIVFATIQYVVAFCCIPGSLETRKIISFSLIGPPCVQSLLSNSLTALILYSPNFTFIFTHFSLLISVAALFATINFLFLVPVLAGIFEPDPWLIGTETEDPTILLPLAPSPPSRRSSSHRNNRSSSTLRSSTNRRNHSYNQPPPSYSSVHRSGLNTQCSSRTNRNCGNCQLANDSLSTITEEPTSAAEEPCTTRRSAEIVVQPQVLVETYDLSGCGDMSGIPTTRTKVSAKLKVEVHSSVTSNTQSSIHSSDNSGTSASTTSASSTASSTSSNSSYND